MYHRYNCKCNYIDVDIIAFVTISIEFSDLCFADCDAFVTISIDIGVKATQSTQKNESCSTDSFLWLRPAHWALWARRTQMWTIIFHFSNSFNKPLNWCTICWLPSLIVPDAGHEVYLILPPLMNELKINLQFRASFGLDETTCKF